MTNSNKNLGEIIKQRRVTMLLTLGELSAKSGVGDRLFHRYRGRYPEENLGGSSSRSSPPKPKALKRNSHISQFKHAYA